MKVTPSRKPMNQTQWVRARRRINIVLLLIIVAMSAWLISDARREIMQLYRWAQPLHAETIRIERPENTVILAKQDTQWQMRSPYEYKASSAVIDALLNRIKQGCRQIESAPTRPPEWYGSIVIDSATYQVGELNHASDEVYVKQADTWFLCDKLLVSMTLAPAINFIDKQLYEGDLQAIIGDFGRLEHFNDIDLSVLEIAPAEVDKLPEQSISSLVFVGDNERRYQAFLSDDNQHLLLFDPEKAIIYVVAAHPKLNAILGL